MRGGLTNDFGRPADITPSARLNLLVAAPPPVEAPSAARSGSFTGSVNSDRSSMDGVGAGRVSWVDALLLIRKSTSQRPTVEAVHPKRLPRSLVDDIVAMAMPRKTLAEKDQTADYCYCFVIRTNKQRPSVPSEHPDKDKDSDKDKGKQEASLADVAPALAASPFVYCYVAYRQSTALKTTEEGTISTLNKQALVLVSLLPIPNLAYGILGTLEFVLYHITHQPPPTSAEEGATVVPPPFPIDGVNKIFEVAMDQIRSTWADLNLGEDGSRWTCNLSLPLFGEVRGSARTALWRLYHDDGGDDCD